VLEEIRIRALGVIDDATLELGPGLTVVTGETGAGKTMVLSGLHLLFGGRADPARVRSGSGRAVIDGRLRMPEKSPLLARARDAGAETDEDGTLLLSRAIAVEGRSRAFLGGSAVPVGVLAELAEGVLTVHGQSDQLRLLRPAEQRAALDQYAGAPVTDLLRDYRAAYERWQELAADLADRTARVRELSQQADMLRHGLADIAEGNPQRGEDEALAAEALRLGRADGLRLAAQTAHEALAGDPAASTDNADVTSLLGAARRAVGQESGNDPELAELAKRLDELSYLAADLATDLASYTERLDADPARLAAVEDRRAVLKALTRKYADTVDGVIEWAADAEERLAKLDVSEDALTELTEQRDAAGVEAALLAGRLSAARSAAAERFGSAVTEELAGLAMPHAEVRAEVKHKPPAGDGPALRLSADTGPVAAGPDGVDEVELLLRPHPGAPHSPIQKGASGGELSRVMLAVEVVFADADPVPTMVFDEVDAGVGGRAAVEVGRRLAKLARDHQVLIVTHLPQVAAYADRHVVVDKLAGEALVTRSDVRTLTEPERAKELARMLAGLGDSELGRAHAEELLAAAAADKTGFAAKKPAKRRG
jgi:DNA repair protein RecN (Recombination protein N)